MNTNIVSSSRITISAVALSALLAVACSGARGGAEEAPPDDAALAYANAALHHDGQAVFEGVFFGQGPVAKLLPEVWESPLPSAHFEALVARRAAIMDQIRAAEPTYFDRVKSELESGDRARIDVTMKEGTQRIATAVMALGSGSGQVTPLMMNYKVLAWEDGWLIAYKNMGGDVSASTRGVAHDRMVDLVARRLVRR